MGRFRLVRADAPNDDRAAGRTSRRSVLLGLLVGMPLSALFLWLATRGLDPGRLWEVLRGAQPAAAALTVLAMVAVYLLQAERWRMVARGQADGSRTTFLALVIGAVAANNLIPGRPGEPLRAYWLSRSARVPFGRALATVVVDRAADVLVLLALLLLVVPFVSLPTWLSSLLLASLALGVVVAAGLAGAWFYARRSSRGRQRRQLAGRRSPLRRHVSGLVRGVADLLDTARLARAATLAALAWLAFAIGAWASGAALGIPISPLEALFLTAVVNLGSAIPSSPGFVGTYQWLVVAALELFSVARSEAFAVSVLLHAAWYVPTTLAGLALAARLGAAWRPARSQGVASAGEHAA